MLSNPDTFADFLLLYKWPYANRGYIWRELAVLLTVVPKMCKCAWIYQTFTVQVRYSTYSAAHDNLQKIKNRHIMYKTEVDLLMYLKVFGTVRSTKESAMCDASQFSFSDLSEVWQCTSGIKYKSIVTYLVLAKLWMV